MNDFVIGLTIGAFIILLWHFTKPLEYGEVVWTEKGQAIVCNPGFWNSDVVFANLVVLRLPNKLIQKVV